MMMVACSSNQHIRYNTPPNSDLKISRKFSTGVRPNSVQHGPLALYNSPAPKGQAPYPALGVPNSLSPDEGSSRVNGSPGVES